MLVEGAKVFINVDENRIASDWDPIALEKRRDLEYGTVIDESNAHGLCFLVKHRDGTEGWYEEHELFPIQTTKGDAMGKKIFAMNEELEIERDMPEGSEWCVYWYETGDYCGSGHAYAGNSNGEYWEKSLGHCSCYGPLEDSWSKIDISDLRMHLIGDTYGIKKKIREQELADLSKDSQE